MPAKSMNKRALERRWQLQSERYVDFAFRDIAWCQVHHPDLLTKYEVSPLTAQNFQTIADLYQDQGGLESPTLECREHLIVEHDDGILCLQELTESNTAILGDNSTTPMIPAADMDQESHSNDVRPQPDFEANGVAHKRRKTTHSVQPVSTPNQRLVNRYGKLQVHEEPARPHEESADISKDAVPVGVYRADPAPARLVTATINPTTRNVEYTIQSLDKDFVQVPNLESLDPASGYEWNSKLAREVDSHDIMFISQLQDKSYGELLQYVFDELRKDSQFDNIWQSSEDMAAHPHLIETLARVRSFTSSETAHGINDQIEMIQARWMLSKVRSALQDLGNSTDLIQKAVNFRGGDEKQEIAQATNRIWAATGKTLDSMFLFRRMMHDNS